MCWGFGIAVLRVLCIMVKLWWDVLRACRNCWGLGRVVLKAWWVVMRAWWVVIRIWWVLVTFVYVLCRRLSICVQDRWSCSERLVSCDESWLELMSRDEGLVCRWLGWTCCALVSCAGDFLSCFERQVSHCDVLVSWVGFWWFVLRAWLVILNVRWVVMRAWWVVPEARLVESRAWWVLTRASWVVMRTCSSWWGLGTLGDWW